jgi:hypothetical protein
MAETFIVQKEGRPHTTWDTIQTPFGVNTLTVEDLSLFLTDKLGASSLQSVSLGDDLLYADYLQQRDGEGTEPQLNVRDMTIAELVIRSAVEGVMGDGRPDEEKEKDTDHVKPDQMVSYYAELITAGMTRKQRVSSISALKEVIQRSLGAITARINALFQGKEFLDLDVLCLNGMGEEMRIPPVRVAIANKL